MTALGRAVIVRWRNMDRWIVPSATILSRHLPSGWQRVPVGDVVELARNAVMVKPEREYAMAGVKWYGQGVFPRETVRGDAMSARWLSPLIPGALIYNRLFAWKASFAVVPEDLADRFVSNEFPQFVPDPAKLIPEYLYLWCVSERTIRAVNAASTGSAAVSRNRLREEFFLNFQIPLPPLAVQRKIVAAWEAARKEAVATAAKIRQLEGDIQARFLTDLGLKAPSQATLTTAFAVWWRDFLRWSVSYNQLAQTGMDLSQSRYRLNTVGSVAAMIQYGTSQKANTAGKGTPVIRMNNLVDGLLDLRDLKHVQLSKSETAKLELADGDILFNRTNSKELVGKCAVFHEEGQYVFASYLIRVRMDTSRAASDFIAYALNSPIGRQQIDAMSRQIIGQANVNSQELRSLEVPLPPLSIQRQIVERIARRRAEIAQLRARTKARSDEATAAVEGMILGDRKVPA